MTKAKPSKSNVSIESHIIVRGAREHNLKNISLNIPKNTFSVITGVSGSGKSSLAFDTIYAEGQRRYIESLSSYARQFIDQLSKPDVDSIDGLAPSISIEQSTTNKNPRSTVGTITEIYDYIRLLYAKVAVPYSPVTNKPLSSQTTEQIVDKILELPLGEKLQILAPIVIERKGEHRKELSDAKKSGFTRVKVNDEIYHLTDNIVIDKNKKNTISLIIDRITIKENSGTRITKSVESAIRRSGGTVIVDVLNEESPYELKFSTRFFCPESGVSFPEPEPRIFSFNSPMGYCPTCKGLGYKSKFDEDLIVPDGSLSIEEGALLNWTGKTSDKVRFGIEIMQSLAEVYDFSLAIPFAKLSKETRKLIFYGSGREEIEFRHQGKYSKYKSKRSFAGVIPEFEKEHAKVEKGQTSGYEVFLAKVPCTVCQGKRLKPETLAFKINDKNVADVNGMNLLEAEEFFSSVKLDKKESQIASSILREIQSRIFFLKNVGLEYLSLSRSAGTLSGGEIQRVRLATQIGSSLTGVLYVLDEPSIGLHQRDNDRLLESLKNLRDRGNTVIVVEHDRDTIEAADFVVDMGPGAGNLGGEIVAKGTPSEIENNKNSITGKFLVGKDQVPLPKKRRPVEKKNVLKIKGCARNNLKNVDLEIPLGTLTCVSGVSGSGKSSLIIQTLVPAVRSALYKNAKKPRDLEYDSIEGLDLIDKIVNIDQSPIGRTPRSNPSTYSGVFGPIRTLFAQTPEALARGYKPGRFSFNVKGGRCETCEGGGMIRVEMHFMPDVFVPCHICNGSRFNRETLMVRYKGKTIADVLNMTIGEACSFFENVPNIYKFLTVLKDVGLDYVTLGQSATTLSGGEAQRMKLSKELSKRSTGKTLYILDEPTTGLHFNDITQLLNVIHQLVDQGNTVVVIEHNLDVLKHADYLIDIGPEGGKRGGQIVASGSPVEVVKSEKGFTAGYLKPYLLPL